MTGKKGRRDALYDVLLNFKLDAGQCRPGQMNFLVSVDTGARFRCGVVVFLPVLDEILIDPKMAASQQMILQAINNKL